MVENYFRSFSLVGLIVFNTMFICSVESQENPFVSEGELQKKADYIIRNSTISRTTIIIADPDNVNVVDGGDPIPGEISILVAESSNLQCALPPRANGESVNHVTSKHSQENGNGSMPASQPVVARVGVTVTPHIEPQKAEAVRLKKKKKQCIIV